MLTLAFVQTLGLKRAGAMRSLAAFLSERTPDVIACCEIDAGDALAVATRFDMEWAYRGGQALLWNRRIAADEVHGLYLPGAALRAFEARGLLRVDGRNDDRALHLFATACASDRSGIRDLRYVRTLLRAATGSVLSFVVVPPTRVGFQDLDFQAVCDSTGELTVAARGFALALVGAAPAQGGLGAALVVRAVPEAGATV